VGTPFHTAWIIGVVADFPIGSVREAIKPAAFYFDPQQLTTISVRLSGAHIPAEIRAIDSVWKTSGASRPIALTFLNQYLQNLYRDITRDRDLFALFAVIAITIACLGLFGLAALLAEQRTKEIGVRKVMGASSAAIVRMLLWQLTIPVLWAGLVASPLSALLLERWLHGFAYHIELQVWLFVAVTAAALVLALATVTAHALKVARARPVSALRYK
jgi:putative ABC transport system permease protein